MQAALPWFKHNSAPNYHSSTPWPWWDRERIRSEETYGFFMKTVIKKRKKNTRKSKTRNASRTSHQQAGGEQFPGKQGIHHTQQWFGKKKAITPDSLNTSLMYAESDDYNDTPRLPRVSCLASVPSQVPVHPLTAEMRWEVLDPMQALLSNNDNISVLSTLVQQKFKTHLHGRYYEGN